MIKTHGIQTHIEEGDWRVVSFHYPGGHYYSIAHYCTAGFGERPVTKGWCGMFYYWPISEKPCYACDRLPPEGIQAVFAMLSTSETENE